MADKDSTSPATNPILDELERLEDIEASIDIAMERLNVCIAALGGDDHPNAYIRGVTRKSLATVLHNDVQHELDGAWTAIQAVRTKLEAVSGFIPPGGALGGQPAAGAH